MIPWTKPTILSVFPQPAYTAATSVECMDRLDELTREEIFDCWREQGHGSADED